ncbi:MAG TPA: cytochrome C [Geobacteraceae bacterium]|nr:cytochrome C [Geobacteraceae bacterium]
MKFLRTTVIRTVLGLALLAATPPELLAFHKGGVGSCDGCHSMHNYQGGVVTPGAYLLRGQDSGSACLNCHEQRSVTGPTSFLVSTSDAQLVTTYPQQLSPGGDFAWLKRNYTWATSTTPINTSPGYGHGHNIAAYDYGYMPLDQAAPGGTYPGVSLTCISCHDPHGGYRRNQAGMISRTGGAIKSSGSYSDSPDPDATNSVGVYRLLGGSGYYPHKMNSGFAFSADPPAAVASHDYNRSEAVSVTRVAYGSGMSEWCRNCHADIHKGADSFTHASPASLGTTYTAYYNSYVKYNDVSGVEGTAYWSLAPFEVGTNNYGILKQIVSTSPTKGPDASDGTPQVMCLSCHRAHASGWDSATRWNNKTDNCVYNGYYAQEGQLYQPYGQGRTEAEALQAYYLISEQRYNSTEPSATFCYKCHNPIPALPQGTTGTTGTITVP